MTAAMDTFTTTIRSSWGDTWEWITTTPEQAEAVWDLLGQPTVVQLVSVQVRHGGQP